jgi:hypothetical protein
LENISNSVVAISTKKDMFWWWSWLSSYWGENSYNICLLYNFLLLGCIFNDIKWYEVVGGIKHYLIKVNQRLHGLNLNESLLID